MTDNILLIGETYFVEACSLLLRLRIDRQWENSNIVQETFARIEDETTQSGDYFARQMTVLHVAVAQHRQQQQRRQPTERKM